MSKDPRKREQEKRLKAEKERRRAIEHARARKGILESARSGSDVKQILSAATRPLYDCRVTRQVFESGMGQVVVCRRLREDTIGAGFFLVDTHCLGIKDAFYREVSVTEYREKIVEKRTEEGLAEADPAYARKLVEEAYAYGNSLGIPQAGKYADVLKLFADVDPADCDEVFEFGANGKPLYMPGPYDSPRQQQQILAILSERLGPDGFNYILPLQDFNPGF